MKRKTVFVIALAIIIVGAAIFLSMRANGIQSSLHFLSHKLGIYTSNHLSGGTTMVHQSKSILTREQKEACVARLVERLEERPWEFGECGENIVKIIKEVTGITIDDSQKSLVEEIFWSAVEQLRKLDDLNSKERRLFDYYNQYVQAFTRGEKATLEQAEKVLGISFSTENRVRVTRKFLFRAIALPILSRTEKRIWDMILNESMANGQPPAIIEIERRLGLSKNQIQEALTVFKKMGLLKGDVDEQRVLLSGCISGPIASEAKGPIVEVFLKDGRARKASCAISALGAGFAVGEQDFIVKAKDPYSGEEIKVEIKNGRIHFFEPKGIFVFNGGSCPNINFFTSKANLKRWQATHPNVEGEVMTLEEAFEYGKKVLGQHGP